MATEPLRADSAHVTPVPASEWDEAMLLRDQAETAYEAYKRDTFSPAFEREKAFLEAHGVPTIGPGSYQKGKELEAAHGTDWKIPDEVNKEVDRLCSAFSDATGELLRVPAPDVAALRWKLDELLTSEPDGEVAAWSGPWVAQTVADYRRLLANEPKQPKAEDWPANLAAYRKVSAEYREFIAHGDGSDEIGAPLSKRWAEACDAMMLTPAPDATALAIKLAIFNNEKLEEDWHCGRDVTKALAQDAARLTWLTNLAALDRVNAELYVAGEDEEVDPAALSLSSTCLSRCSRHQRRRPPLVRKLEVLKEHHAWGFYETPEIMDALIVDARRLTEAGAGMAA